MYSISRAGGRAITLVLAVAAMACSKKDDSSQMDPGASATGVETMPPAAAALRVSEIELGKGLKSDKTLGDETDSFGVRDTIYAVVKTDGASSGSKLDAKWTFQSGQMVSESSQTVSPTGGEARHEFHLQKSSAWPKGNYKLEVMLDGMSAGTKDFSIK